jgi:thiol-disulfide isomerase/thioredoxin
MNRGVLVALAIVVAAAAGFVVQRQVQPAAATASPSSATQEPAAGPTAEEAAAAAPAQKIPETLPRFLLADRDGNKRSLKDWAGQPLMVNFWATWCPPCRKEIPLLNQIRAKHAAQRLEIVGIAVDFREDVLKYAETNPISYPLLIGEEDGQEAMKAFGMEGAGFPFTFFADSKQRIVAMKLGELHQDEADLILEKLMAVDAGKLDLDDARQQISEGMKEIATRRAVKATVNAKPG